MVSAQNEEVLWVFDFVRKQKADGLQRLLSAIDIVSKEQIVCFRWKTAILEKSQQIVVLSVNVTLKKNPD